MVEEKKESAVLEATLTRLKLSLVWARVGLRLTNAVNLMVSSDADEVP